MSRMIKNGCLVLGLMFLNTVSAQQNMLPLHTFYKEKFIEVSGKRSIETFFPANESQLDLHHLIRDSSTQYYDFTDWFFKKHWITISRPEGNLTISPLVNFAYGKETTNPDRGALFRNTRGLYVEGELLNKIGFNFIFAENQARFMDYESAYFDSRGELQIADGVYHLQHAVIPGGNRTKPFKENAYDYAYSIGSISYELNKNLRFEVGNNQHFIGSGYRSLLLSDNSLVAPNFKVNWKISSRWSYQVLFQRNKNLYRKPATASVEAPYESKLFAATYLTFKPRENFSLSLFTAGNQLRGDSLVKHAMQAQMLIPLPFVQNDLLFGKSALFNGITGLNADFALKNTRIYGQVALDKFDKTYLIAGQLGAHFFRVLKVKNLNAQLEANLVPEHFYASRNPKLAYSNGNLPLAHTRGNNFGEVLMRWNYEIKRVFVNSKTIYYTNLGGNDSIPLAANSIFSAQENVTTLKAATFIQEFEIGYRINRKYNAMLSAGWKGRFYQGGNADASQQMFFIGLKTGIINQYLDF